MNKEDIASGVGLGIGCLASIVGYAIGVWLCLGWGFSLFVSLLLGFFVAAIVGIVVEIVAALALAAIYGLYLALAGRSSKSLEEDRHHP